MDENEKKNLNGSIKSFIGDRLSKAKEKDVKEKSGDSVSSGTGIDRSNIRQPKAGFGKTESSSSTGTEVKEDGGELSAEEVRKAREKAETERIKAEKEAEKKLKAEKAREEKAKREEEKKKRQEEKQEAAKLKKEEAQKKKEEALRKKEEAAAAAAAAGASAGAAAGASEKAEGKENIWKEKFSEFKRSIKENDFEGTDIEEEDEFEHVPMDDDKRKTRGRVKLFVTLGAAAAIAIIAIVFSLRNNSYGYIFNQGVNQFNNEEYDDAVATFEKLYELEPGKKDTELMRYLAESYVKKNRYKEALEIYNKALETDPNYGPAVTGLCAMYSQMKDGKALNETLEKYRGTNLESFTDEYKVAMPESDPKPGTYDEDFEDYAARSKRGELPVRMTVCLDYMFEKPKITEKERNDPYCTAHLGSFKSFSDGSLGSRSAKLYDDYSDDPGNSGILVITPEGLKERMYEAYRHGLQPATHCIGDQALDVTLSAVEYCLEQGRKDGMTQEEQNMRLPFRIIHAQMATPGLIERMKKLLELAELHKKVKKNE